MNKEKKYSSPYEFEGSLPLKQAIPMGLQHVRVDEYDNCFTISDKARCVAGGVLEAILHLRG